MRSSTSASNDRLPRLRYGRTWLVALTVALLAWGGWECHWRRLGYDPQIKDDYGLWASERARVQPTDVVVVGSSRPMCDIDLDVFARLTSVVPRQLGTTGSTGLAVLKQLMGDGAFHGLILCEYRDFDVSAREGSVSDEWVEKYAHPGLFDGYEAWCRLQVDMRAVSRCPQLSCRDVLPFLLKGDLPPRTLFKCSRNRQLALQTSRFEAQQLARHWEGMYKIHPWTPPGEFRQAAEQLDVQVQAFQKRGGSVVFIQYPISGAMLESARRLYPAEQYWTVFKSVSHAWCIGFEELPHPHPCADGSHLDGPEAAAFTADLVAALAAHHVALPTWGRWHDE